MDENDKVGNADLEDHIADDVDGVDDDTPSEDPMPPPVNGAVIEDPE